MRRDLLHTTALIAILLAGAFARFTGVQARGIWFDEGITLSFTAVGLNNIVEYTIQGEDANPPVYRVMLGGWMQMAGITPFSARVFGGFLGLLAVAVMYRIGRLLRLTKAASLMGALFAALSPMQVYYSREIKHYIFAQLFLLIGVWVWLRMFPEGQSQRGLFKFAVAAAISSALALGGHYISALMLFSLGIWTLVWAAWRLKAKVRIGEALPSVLVWGAAQIVAGLVLLPWVLLTAKTAVIGASDSGSDAGMIALPPLKYIASMFTEFAAGAVGSDALRASLTGLMVGASVAGILSMRVRGFSRMLLLLWIGVPLLIGFLVQTQIPFFFPRFLLFVCPALMLLAGAGIDAVLQRIAPRERAMRTAPAAVLYGAAASMLIAAQINAPQPRPDLHPIAAAIAADYQAGDALIYGYPWQAGMLAAYLPSEIKPAYYAAFRTTVDDLPLETITRGHGRVWLLAYQLKAEDENNRVGNWLLTHAATSGSQQIDENQLTLFVAADQAVNPGSPNTCVTLGEESIRLCYAPLDGTGKAGVPTVIALTWEALKAIEARYIIFVHFIGPDSPIPAAQQDSQPVNGLAPSYTWDVGEMIHDLHAVIAPSITEETTYQVLVGLYDADTLARVPVDSGGDSVEIGFIRIQP